MGAANPTLLPDSLLSTIADYVIRPDQLPESAFETAHFCLMDALGCALAALAFPACTRLLGPVVPGTVTPNGARLPGTTFQLDPVTAAFDLGAMIRWLDFNDTWLAAEWGHPSDNLGGILMAADCASRQASAAGQKPLTVRDILAALIQAYEIQGVLALENSFNRVGVDHVLLVRVATAAVVSRLLGGSREQILAAVSNAWVDGGSLRVYRHAPNTGSRKSWAAGDATARGVFLASLALRGEMGYPTALTTLTWGFQDVLFRGQTLSLARPLGAYVVENILFKVAFPAEFHAQTAVEAAFQLHPQVQGHLEEIERVVITTQESALRIISKEGPLYNPADRDHCIQYMTAVALIHGKLTAEDYEDEAARDPRIDALREKMVCIEDPQYSRDYLDSQKRSIANAVQVFFHDGSSTPKVEVHYPLGHRRRRREAQLFLEEKFRKNVRSQFSEEKINHLVDLFTYHQMLDGLPVPALVDQFAI